MPSSVVGVQRLANRLHLESRTRSTRPFGLGPLLLITATCFSRHLSSPYSYHLYKIGYRYRHGASSFVPTTVFTSKTGHSSTVHFPLRRATRKAFSSTDPRPKLVGLFSANTRTSWDVSPRTNATFEHESNFRRSVVCVLPAGFQLIQSPVQKIKIVPQKRGTEQINIQELLQQRCRGIIKAVS